MIKFLERAIAAISPEWACKRAFFAENLRAYEAGEITRFNDGWVPVNSDTENTDKTQRDLVKARARYLENNSDIACAAVGGIVRNVVGTGIRLQARTGDENLNKRIEQLWREFMNHKITAAEWWKVYEAFTNFQQLASKYNLCPNEIDRIEDIMLENCPIPQPQPMRV